MAVVDVECLSLMTGNSQRQDKGRGSLLTDIELWI